MKYKVVFNNGNPEDANLCCLCEDFVWAEIFALMLNERYHKSHPDTIGKDFYRVIAQEK